MFLKKIFPLIAAIILIIGCSDMHLSRDNIFPEDLPPFIRVEELFESERDENGITRTTFSTNDRRFWTLEGMTIWTVWGDSDAPFTSRTVMMSKPNGFYGGGYGLVICQGEHEIDGVYVPVMLVVMINNNGQYIIGKAVGGVFTDFGWWQSTPHLNSSAGAPNSVTVTLDTAEDEFILIINGYEVERFRDTENPVLRSGRSGYIVVTTPFDNFPHTWVIVHFWEEK